MLAAQEAAAAARRLFPLSLASEGSATVGGILSTNAGGEQVLRYGNARELALGLEVVLADGSVLDLLGSLRKDNTGYDLKQLFIGGEGTLGIVTAATLRLFARPTRVVTAWVAVRDPAAAVELLARFGHELGERVTAFELIARPPLALVLQHAVPGMRDPLDTPHPWAVLLDVSEVAPSFDPRPAVEPCWVGMDDGLVAARRCRSGHGRGLWHCASTCRRHGSRGSRQKDIRSPARACRRVARRREVARSSPHPHHVLRQVGDGNLHYNQSKPLA